MRYKRVGKLCTQCGHERPLYRFTHDPKRCDYCVTGQYKDTQAMRDALRWARTKALRDMPYQVICAKCTQPRPASYYPWIGHTAVKGDTCNACLRGQYVHKGGRPVSVIAAYRPGPAEDWTQRTVARVLEREQARLAEQRRVQAEGAQCHDCWHHKPASAFRLDTRRRTGICASCRDCETLFKRLSPLGQWVPVRDALRALA